MKETRTATINPGEGMKLVGRPIVYDEPTRIEDGAGGYIEVIERGALDGADLSDSTLIYNHDETRVPLARTPKTMRFDIDEAGLCMEASLADDNQTAREVYSAVKRGDLSGMSFAFTVPEGGSYYDPVNNVRHILKIAKVYEVSVVPFPAYPQTSVEARGQMQAARKDLKERRNALIACNKILLRSVN